MKWSVAFVKRSLDALVKTHLGCRGRAVHSYLCARWGGDCSRVAGGSRVSLVPVLGPEVLRRADSSITCWSTISPEVHCVAIAGQTWCYPRTMGQGACCSTNHSIIYGCITSQCCTTFCPCQSSRFPRFITLSWTLPPSSVCTHLPS